MTRIFAWWFVCMHVILWIVLRHKQNWYWTGWIAYIRLSITKEKIGIQNMKIIYDSKFHSNKTTSDKLDWLNVTNRLNIYKSKGVPINLILPFSSWWFDWNEDIDRALNRFLDDF